MSNSHAIERTQDSRYIHNGQLTLLESEDYFYYADNLPWAAKLYTVLSVVASIVATPLVLLCYLPTIASIKKVRCM